MMPTSVSRKLDRSSDFLESLKRLFRNKSVKDLAIFWRKKSVKSQLLLLQELYTISVRLGSSQWKFVECSVTDGKPWHRGLLECRCIPASSVIPSLWKFHQE